MADWQAPRVRLALEAILAAQTGAGEPLEGIDVWPGHPGDDLPKRCVVLLNTEGSQDWAALGRHAKDERFVIRGSVFIQRTDATKESIRAAQTDAADITEAVGQIVRADPTLGGVVRVANFGVRLTTDGGALTRGRWEEATFEIECQVRI